MEKLETRIEAVELLSIAGAYLDCGIQLCESLLEGETNDVHRNRVPLHLAHVALELYFKAGLLAAGHTYPRTHDIVALQREYEQALPECPLRLPRFVEDTIPTTLELFADMPSTESRFQYERFRYYADKQGRPWPELPKVDLEQLTRDLEKLNRDAAKATFEIWNRYGAL